MYICIGMDEIFERAARHAKTLKNVSEENMLNLYGLYKQANFGPCNISKPYFWDMTGKAKWESWNSLGNLTKYDAKQKYIDLIKVLDLNFDEEIDNSSMVNQPKGLGLAVSTLNHDIDEQISDADKTIFDWCKEGNLKKLQEYFDSDKNLINVVDNENRSLLHWAVDRNFVEVIEFLLMKKCHVNLQDLDGQTALHYAVTCEYENIVALLLKNNADVSIKDNDGLTALDACDSVEIRNLFASG